MSKDPTRDVSIKPYWGPVGGWGSVKSVAEILLREAVPLKGPLVLWEQNKPRGFACVSCAWAKPDHPGPFEFCENGAKATAWEITDKRCPPEFFAEHTLAELESWSDYDLEEAGRLTHPMRWDATSDKYVPVAWDEAFAAIGAELQRARSEVGRLLRLGPRLARSLVHVPAVGAHVRQQQPARQLQHVPREHVGGAAADHRRAGRHREARRLRAHRLHVVLRPERRRQQPAHAASAAGHARARRADHHLQSAARARPRALHQSAVAVRDADAVGDADQHAVSPAQSRRRHRGADGHVQGPARHGRGVAKQRAASASSTSTSSPRTPAASRHSSPACVRFQWPAHRSVLRPVARRHRSRG